MKKILPWVIFALLVSNGFSQNPLQARLYFKDGTSITGFANLVSIDKSKTHIKYREEFYSSNIKKIPSNQLTKIVYFKEENRYEYYYLERYNKNKNRQRYPRWYKLVHEGYISLFSNDRSPGELREYFIKHKGENAVSYVATQGSLLDDWRFRRFAKRNFADYKSLLKKILSKENTIVDIEKVIKIYNTWLLDNKQQKK
ncbi:MAG: hypothetical protein R6V52_07875 [Bacteroidales bacterium]